MMSTTLNPEAMTASEIDAMLAHLRQIKKGARDAENARYSELARELIETLLLEHDVEPSDYSDRVGYSTQNLSIKVGGRVYTFYLALKDVSATEVRKAQIDAGEITLKKRGKKNDSAE